MDAVDHVAEAGEAHEIAVAVEDVEGGGCRQGVPDRVLLAQGEQVLLDIGGVVHAAPLVQADSHPRVEGLLELLPLVIDPLLEAQPVGYGAVPLLGVEPGRRSGLAVADVAERIHAGVEVVPRSGHVVHPTVLAALAPIAKEAAGAVGAVDPCDPHRVRVEERHEAEVPAHLCGILLGGEVAALIVQVPVARPERFRAPVRTAFSGQVGVVWTVAVLDPVMEVGDAAVAE